MVRVVARTYVLVYWIYWLIWIWDYQARFITELVRYLWHNCVEVLKRLHGCEAVVMFGGGREKQIGDLELYRRLLDVVSFCTMSKCSQYK